MGYYIVYYDKGTGERYLSTCVRKVADLVNLHKNTLLRKFEGGRDVYNGERYLLLKFNDSELIRGDQRFPVGCDPENVRGG